MNQANFRHIMQLEARVSRLEATVQALLGRLDINPAEVIPQEPPADRAIHDAIRAALLAGNKIQAIALYREHYGVSLKEAKDAIDAMW